MSENLEFEKENWTITIGVYKPGLANKNNEHEVLESVLFLLPPEYIPAASLGEKAIYFSLYVKDSTKKEAILTSYERLVTAYETFDQDFDIMAARLATSHRESTNTDEATTILDITSDIIDLERNLRNIRNLNSPADM